MTNLIIVALDTQERLSVEYTPRSIDYTRTANLGKFKVIGRNIPKVQYTGGNTTMKLTLDFVSNGIRKDDVMYKCTWLESLACTDGYDKSQEKIMLVMGKLFSKKEWVISDVKIKYQNFHSKNDYLPVIAQASLSLQLVADHNIDYSDVKLYTLAKTAPTFGEFYPAKNLADVIATNNVSISNPYADGKIMVKRNGQEVLKRTRLSVVKNFLKKATYRAIIQGESLESIAYTTFRSKFPNASKYWWVLADVNGMRGNPLDLRKQIGKEILLPNLHEIIFNRSLKL